jgi:hypothetical protein
MRRCLYLGCGMRGRTAGHRPRPCGPRLPVSRRQPHGRVERAGESAGDLQRDSRHLAMATVGSRHTRLGSSNRSPPAPCRFPCSATPRASTSPPACSAHPTRGSRWWRDVTGGRSSRAVRFLTPRSACQPYPPPERDGPHNPDRRHSRYVAKSIVPVSVQRSFCIVFATQKLSGRLRNLADFLQHSASRAVLDESCANPSKRKGPDWIRPSATRVQPRVRHP